MGTEFTIISIIFLTSNGLVRLKGWLNYRNYLRLFEQEHLPLASATENISQMPVK